MRPPVLLCLFVAVGYSANAQLFILPQAGIENSRTVIQFNDHSFSPLGRLLSPQAAFRLEYKNKRGFGPFLGIASSRSGIRFNFSDPQTAMNYYTASKANTQLRLEAGYQVSSKRIYFKKTGFTGKSTVNYKRTPEKRSCENYSAANHCGSKMNKAYGARSAARGSWVRLQPSLGIAYMPSTPPAEISAKSLPAQASYEYTADNRKTALISGLGFEFGKNEQQKFNVEINYLQSFGATDTKSLITLSGNKSTTTGFRSDASVWNLRIGIPISLSKKKPVAKFPVTERIYRHDGYKSAQYRCNQYRHCGKVI